MVNVDKEKQTVSLEVPIKLVRNIINNMSYSGRKVKLELTDKECIEVLTKALENLDEETNQSEYGGLISNSISHWISVLFRDRMEFPNIPGIRTINSSRVMGNVISTLRSDMDQNKEV